MMESATGKRIKEDFEAQKLRRFISVGHGLNTGMIKSELKSKQLQGAPKPPGAPQ